MKGANVALRDLDAELGSVTVVLESGGTSDLPVAADASVLLLAADGRARSDDDLVFYNQPVALGGAIHLREKVRSDAADDSGEDASADIITLELDDVPDDVDRIVLAASIDPGSDATFGDATVLSMRLQRTADAQDVLSFPVEGASRETALLFGEFYRRNGEWRVRAIGQGYEHGLAALIADHGIAVQDDSSSTMTDPPEAGTEPVGAVEAIPADDAGDEAAGDSASVPGPAAQTAQRRLSVRRPARAPRMPADWNATIPADDVTDWQRARLFPVAGIGGGEEQERRATSALLAVMSLVRDFGRALTARCGAPAGMVETFIEVPFGHDEEAYRPDGVIRVTRGQRMWQALVEAKTATGQLRADQVESYLGIAKDKGYDAVVTISNELAGAEDSPVSVDRRKLKKVKLIHLSWDQIRTQAVLLTRHHGVADPTQRRVLDEFVRYMSHPKSGLHGFTDMGPRWVGVRDAVKARTLRSGDRNAAEVSGRFDQLVEHVALRLSALLGVEVQSLPPRNAPDAATRCQQLADSGLLFGTLRVPGAVDVLVLSADLRAERVACSIQLDAPRDGRPLTRVNWLLRQLPVGARDSLRVEAALAGGRGASTAALVGALRKKPEQLLPADGREIRAFRVVMEAPIGSRRSSVPGGLIKSVQDLTNSFYAEVVQNLSPWNARPPRVPAQ
ncbi:stress response protein, TerZ- and CABP1 [Nakamurella endophytica]|uniref:Stress response protein, TerZ- and CABP1 n=1 Tax=Nakamurella endophytica TaxID=1748367 RepID=A0A917SV04_9ACTN|nr:stress response protein, TerZ- and CABP1 [Nakamurella endophytica]